MDRNTAREYIHAHAADYLQRDKSGKGYVCPVCKKSGTGKNGTGITTKDGIHYTCWAGCFTNADLIDIIGQEAGATGYTDKLQAACKVFGITLDDNGSASSRPAQKPIQAAARSNQQQEQQPADYTNFFLKANRNLNQTDYHRGISGETLDRFHIGFVQAWRHPKAPNAPASPRLIIPTSNISYIARDTRANLTDEQKKYSKQKVGPAHIFNLEALQSAEKPVFIVEGEIDALSIIDVSGAAVGLGSISNIPKFLKLLGKQQQKPEQPLIIAMDSDDPGNKAAEQLEAGLKELGISYYRPEADLFGSEVKDANGALMFDRDCFKRLIREVEQEAIAAAEELKDAARREYMTNSAASYIQSFIKGLANTNTDCFPTGFKCLDEVLDGGLYEGLYVIGAISSLGKTTLVLQAADQIAQNGQDVLIFSLEMARTELMAKSFSRETMRICLENGMNVSAARSTRDITTFWKKYRNKSQEERKQSSVNEQRTLIEYAINAYAEYADHIFITEGMGDVGTDQIRQTVEKHISITGRKPVVVIDYLQILAPYSDKATDKQNTDKAVVELKRISRDFKIPVIGISSFNRESYKAAVTMSAFKESGSIEYSADVLIGLQFDAERNKNGKATYDENVEKRKTPRKIELVVLKNRNGQTGDTIKFDFYSKYNLFKEVGFDK